MRVECELDDYTWKRRVRERKQRRRFERTIFLCLFVVAASFVIWYIMSYTKTPNYAMKEAFEAFQSGDSEIFLQHLDLNSITAKAYDDLTWDLFKYDTNLSTHDRLLFENFYVLIRPQMCQGAIKVIETRFTTGEWTLPEEILKGRQLGIDYDLLLERSLIRHTTVLDVDNVENHGDHATMDIHVVEDNSQTNFTLKATLQNFGGTGWQISGTETEFLGATWKFSGMSFILGDNLWKVVSIDNYKDYLATVSSILIKDLTEYIDATADVVYYYNEIFRDEQNNFIVLQRTRDGILEGEQRQQIFNYINDVIIPNLEERQFELNRIEVPKGARYLANLRKQSTEITIQAWQAYAKGIIENDAVAFETAESIHKQQLALDQRIEEIIRNSAVARNRPELP